MSDRSRPAECVHGARMLQHGSVRIHIPSHGWLIFHCMYTLHLLIHSSVDGPLGFLHFGAIMDNAAMDIHVQGFVRTHVFSSLGFIPEQNYWVTELLQVTFFEELPDYFPKSPEHPPKNLDPPHQACEVEVPG